MSLPDAYDLAVMGRRGTMTGDYATIGQGTIPWIAILLGPQTHGHGFDKRVIDCDDTGPVDQEAPSHSRRGL